MIKDKKFYQEFEDEFLRNEKLTLDEKFRIYDEMYLWAKELGVFPLKDPLEGIEDDIKLAKFFKKLAEKYERERKKR